MAVDTKSSAVEDSRVGRHKITHNHCLANVENLRARDQQIPVLSCSHLECYQESKVTNSLGDLSYNR